jgi:hypothetical protein
MTNKITRLNDRTLFRIKLRKNRGNLEQVW